MQSLDIVSVTSCGYCQNATLLEITCHGSYVVCLLLHIEQFLDLKFVALS